ncbi:MAG: beta-lactamase family protein [Gammaproteobacteria bacterium]|nr:beta-lactamase family protein [Gammaproteobacteria bacterium]
MKKLLKRIRNLILIIIALVVTLIGYLFITEPVVMTRTVEVLQGGPLGPGETVPGVASTPLPMESKQSFSGEALEEMIEFGAATNSHALIVWHGDGIALEQYYPGYDEMTRSGTQSMHKSVVAILVGKAIEDGYINSVDDSASLYLTEWADDDRSKITIKQMLRQTSGINFSSVKLSTMMNYMRLMVGPDVQAETLYLPLEVEPGTRFDYNTVIPQNMGLILQRATGKRYSEYLSEALWKPIGATDANVILDSEEKGMARTGCCLDATARSWLRVGLLHLNEGSVGGKQIVSKQWMKDIVVPGDQNSNYGYFTWLGTDYVENRRYNRKSATSVYHSEPFAAPDVIYFDGFGGSRVYIVPSKELVIVRTGDIFSAWDDAYLPNMVIRALQ